MSDKQKKLFKKLVFLQLFSLIIFAFGNIVIVAQNTSKTMSAEKVETQNAVGNSSEWYLHFRSKTEPKIYVREIGKGKNVVVLHGGFGADYSYMVDATNGLEDKFRFVFYDQRGSLRSPAKLEDISIDKHIEDLEALRIQLGEERINIFAHSMGTVLAMLYLKKYPNRVKKLILTGAFPIQTENFMDLFQNKFNAAVEKLVTREVWKIEKEKIAPDGKPANDRQATDLWKIDFASANIYRAEKWRQMKGGQSFYKGSVGSKTSSTLPKGWDLTGIISKHSFPVTYIQGEKDFIDLEVENHKKQLTSLKNVELSVINNAGHNAWIDDPLNYKKALLKALIR